MLALGGQCVLKQRLHCAKAAHPQTRNQQLFDQLQQTAAQYLREGHPVTEGAILEYVTALQQIRLAEFTEWMAQLPQWPAIVNLPSLAKFYGGRVIEAMAAGRPVISWNIPDHPQNLGLFEPGKTSCCSSRMIPRPWLNTSIASCMITRLLRR